MAEFKLLVCDGCDGELKVASDETDNFYHIRVTAGSWGRHVDLCPDCHTKLLKEIDPSNWMRFKEERRVA
jgi:hypothetical protein